MRTLSAALQGYMDAPQRLPAYRIELYDVRSTSGEVDPTTISDVVLYNLALTALPEIVGPRDVTDDVVSVQLVEMGTDFLEGGPAASSAVLTIADPTGALDPVENAPTQAAPEADGRWLRQGNVVVIREGDVRVPADEWAITFTGRIKGQAGASRSRTTGRALLTARAASREADFLTQLATSADFPLGTPFTEIARDLAETDMGLTADEVVLPGFSVRTTAHAHTQFADEAPLTLLARLMFPDGFMPRFRGDGRLGATSSSITKGAARSYPDLAPIISIERPPVEVDGDNEVELVGLSATLSRVLQPRQTLATAGITTGFFSRRARIPVRWSDDGTQQAIGVRMDIDASVADGIFGFGSERFTPGPADADGGVCRGEIDVDGGREASVALASLLAGAWIFAHSKPDGVVAFGTGTVSGYTIALGRVVEGAIGQALMTILGRIGRGQYRVTGQPYELVFDEIRVLAQVAGLRDAERKTRRIENHLINTQEDCEAVAARVLARLRAQQNSRQIEMIHDLALEPDDIFATGTGTARRLYMVQSIRRTLSREGRLEAQIEAFEVTPGVRP